MTLTEQVAQLSAHVDMVKQHVADLEKGKKAASAKARGDLQKIKLIAHDLRKSCMEHQKSIPVKKRTKVVSTAPVVAESEAPVVAKKTKRKKP